MVRLLGENESAEHHLCEASDTVEIDDAEGCVTKDYVEGGTRRGHSRGRCGLNVRMTGGDDRKDW